MSDQRRWFEQPKDFVGTPKEGGPETPDLWTKCPGCSEMLFNETLTEHLWVCEHCDHHFRIDARARLQALSDADSLVWHDAQLVSVDTLRFVDSKPYATRIEQSRRKMRRNDAYAAASGEIDGINVELGAFEFGFMGGSMGSVVGEMITNQVERAIERRCPAVIVSSSGGARMQEGVLSLMQMGKTSAALSRLKDEASMPYISILTHPTTGGVAASFAMLGDIILAEPRSLIGFAGPRVIQQTIGQELPEGFQTAEYLIENGMIDAIVSRGDLRETLARLLRMLLRMPSRDGGVPVGAVLPFQEDI